MKYVQHGSLSRSAHSIVKPRARGLLLSLLIFALALPAMAQLETGTVTGRVTDSAGAVVTKAQITLVNTGTNLTLQDTSNANGIFNFPALNPGTYKVTAKHKGFEKSVTTVEVSVGDTAHADLTLSIGSEDVTVVVTASDVYQLESQTAAVDYIVSKEEVQDLPLDGGNPYALAALVPGINPGSQFGVGLDQARGALQTVGNANFGTNGGINGSNEILLDGVPITVCCNGQPALTPSVAIVEQLRVLTSVPPAQYGRTSGGVLNYSTFSGVNRVHGQIYEFFQNTKLHAANFFAKADQYPISPAHPGDYRLPLHYNQYGIGIGGPIVIPHIYNGRDKTFFYAGYAGVDTAIAAYTKLTVPTDKQRAGNLSEACKNLSGASVACSDSSVDPKTLIYDPSTYNPSTGKRTAYANNTIPNFDHITAAYLQFFPHANICASPTSVPGQSPLCLAQAITNNFGWLDTVVRTDRQFSLRIDHEFTPRQRILLRGTYTYNHDHNPDYFGNYSGFTSSHQNIMASVAAVQDTWVLTPNTVLTLQYGLAFQRNSSIPGAYNYQSSSVGFGTNYTSLQSITAIPSMSISGYSALGSSQILHDDKYTHTVGASTITQFRAHTITLGFDGRYFVFNNGDLADPDGTFAYGSTFTSGPNANNTLPTGQSQFVGFASFLLGLPTSGNLYLAQRVTDYQTYGALYVQDNWRAGAKLTLDLGLRYDVEPGPVEKRNRFADFDPTVTSPLAATLGIPLTGGLAFRGVAGHSRQAFAANWTQFSPRLGFAYAIHPDTVIRGAAGILYLPTSQRLYGIYNGASQVSTAYLSTVDQINPVGSIEDPFPNGLQPLPNPSAGGLANVGTDVGGLLYNTPPSYVEQYHLNVQQSLKRDMVLSVAYVGSHGVKLPINFTANDLNPAFYSYASNPSAGTAYLDTLVPNPYYGLSNSGNYAKPNIALYYLLTRYPQYNSVTEDLVGQGTASYNSLQGSLRAGWRNGGSLNITYVWSKALGDVNNLTTGFIDTGTPGYQNSYLPKLERSYTTTDVPQRLVISAVGRIPYGHGQTYGHAISGWMEGVLGNWQVNGILTFQSGLPQAIGETGQGVFGGSRPNLIGNPQTSGPIRQRLGGVYSTLPYFNPTTTTYVPVPSLQPSFQLTQAFQLGNISRLCGLCRAQGQASVNASLFKNVQLDRIFKLQIRVEMYNVLNRVQFGNPNDTYNGASFGQITTQANNPRTIQLGLKLLW